jgi:hypothetical protein
MVTKRKTVMAVMVITEVMVIIVVVDRGSGE